MLDLEVHSMLDALMLDALCLIIDAQCKKTQEKKEETQKKRKKKKKGINEEKRTKVEKIKRRNAEK